MPRKIEQSRARKTDQSLSDAIPGPDHPENRRTTGEMTVVFVSKTVDGLDHHFKFVPQFGQLAQMVTNLSFPAVFLGLAYLLLIGSAVA